MNGDRQTKGFIPDVYRLFNKYRLESYPRSYLQTATFPGKYAWKSVLKKNVIEASRGNMMNRLCCQGHEWLYDSVIPRNATQGCSGIWKLAGHNPQYLPLCKLLMKSTGAFISRSVPLRCQKCALLSNNMTEHLLYYCVKNHDLRLQLWSALFDSMTFRNYLLLIKRKPTEQCKCVLKLATDNDGKVFDNLQVTITVGKLLQH